MCMAEQPIKNDKAISSRNKHQKIRLGITWIIKLPRGVCLSMQQIASASFVAKTR